MTSQPRVYDGVISLGTNCASAMQIEMRGLRTFSGPLDWIAFRGKLHSGGGMVQSILSSDFQMPLNPEQLQLEAVTPTSHQDYLGDYLAVDKVHGIAFPHDFATWPPTAEVIATVQARYARRSERLVQCLSTPKTQWLVVFNNGALPCEPTVVVNFLKTLRTIYPQATIDCFAVLFERDCEISGEEVAPGCFITQTRRKFRDLLDFSQPDATWKWLDGVSIAKPGSPEANRKRIAAFDTRVLTQITRWLTVDKRTLKLYHKTFRYAYGRGYCRFCKERWSIRLLMGCWRKTRWTLFLKWVASDLNGRQAANE